MTENQINKLVKELSKAYEAVSKAQQSLEAIKKALLEAGKQIE